MKKLSAFILSTLLISFAFTGCFNPVFYTIRQDVPPETATVNGNINSIARYTVGETEYLVLAANGGLRYKKASEETHGCWKTVSKLPFELHHFEYYEVNSDSTTGVHRGQQIVKVLADATNLYLVTVEYKNHPSYGTTVPKQFYIWSIKVTDWDNIAEADWSEIGSTYTRANSDGSENTDLLQFYDSNEYYKTRFNVFSTNSVQKAHRKVFIRSGSDKGIEYYALNGGVISTYSTPTTVDTAEKDDKIDGVVWFKGGVKFFTSSAVCTNETAENEATMVYFGQEGSSNLYYYNGVGEPVKALAAGEEIACLAVTSDALLIGRGNYSNMTNTSGGIVKTDFADSDGTPGSSLVAFTTNAPSQLSSAYLMYTLLVVDPAKAELDSAIYSSIGFRGSGASTAVNYKNIGLWSYYPERGNWNRE